MHTIPFLWQCFRIGLEVALEKGIEIPYLSVFCEHSTIYISDTFHEIFRAVYSLKFHETLKGRWLSTRNILVTARLILAGDFWLMIQKNSSKSWVWWWLHRASFTTSTASKTQLPLPTIFKVKQQYHYQQLCACTKTDNITLVWFQQCSLVQSLLIVIITV